MRHDHLLLDVIEEGKAVAGAEGAETPAALESQGGDGGRRLGLEDHAWLEARGKLQGVFLDGQGLVSLPDKLVLFTDDLYRVGLQREPNKLRSALVSTSMSKVNDNNNN